MAWIDTHAHVYSEEFSADRTEVIARCHERGISKIYMPNVDHASMDGMLLLEQKHPDLCVPMMGLHPCYVKNDFERELYLVEDWLNKRSFCAIGEIGTDLYWDKTFWPQQQEAFKIQMTLARKHKLPVVIHCRESIDETIALLENMAHAEFSGVFHCFTGNLAQAQKIISMGFYLGYGGVATFKNGGQDKVIPHIPIESIVLETDSPYLAPVPHRGKRNEPAYLELIAARVAELKGISIGELSEHTTRNAQTLFGVNPKPNPAS